MIKILTSIDIAALIELNNPNYYTRCGALALGEWLDEYMPDDHPFDSVAIRCAFESFKSFEEFVEEEFGSQQECAETLGIEDWDDSEKRVEAIKKHINKTRAYIEHEEGLIVTKN
tara:strand:+ start:4050 stop:4394 length:345 start_codon:yes stop_codon:yes gene_type:complete